MSVRIANAAGFWGDDNEAPRRVLEHAEDLDYLTMDYLAEVTMTVLVRQQENDPEKGYATDFPSVVDDILTEAMDRGVTILANAGGVNPQACREAVASVADERGLEPTIATVSGDDFRDRIEEFDDERLRHADTGEALPTDPDVVSANAYFGGFPVAEALAADPDVVITGRVIDAALILGPLIHEHGWDRDEYDRLARGLIAGHIIECGAQATGGNFLGDWRGIDFEHIGFPIAEVEAEGSTVITKPSGTGGLVTPDTVGEQLLYEVADPGAYYGPDVVADFQHVRLEQVGEERVAVENVTGTAPTDTYKASLHYRDGFTVRSDVVYANPNAAAKANRAFEYIRNRADERGIEYDRFRTESFGVDALHDGTASGEPEEVVARIAIETPNKGDGYEFASLFANLGLGGPPSVTMFNPGRSSPTPKFAYHPVLVPKSAFEPIVEVTGA
ncbi:Protein of unknown function [Natronorubrum sediminis]|uniref:Acyclic terpene utilisation N-terminal domain-containing protein n=1 Tax=Natronorubrum sediminis TaxID=640943 RepID=A0A1H6G755_9EURY|nr:acyclic terpene utilization AtuA family protein [Natronorubrum sediminis]SEH18163.1 Protein of unknown function [Natronorubrum sediminis]